MTTVDNSASGRRRRMRCKQSAWPQRYRTGAATESSRRLFSAAMQLCRVSYAVRSACLAIATLSLLFR